MPTDNRPIGVLDSGVGGISVLRKLVSLMPNENFIYYGDSANAPYGTRSTDEICTLTRATVDALCRMDCKCIVIACNTATTACADVLRQQYPDIPIIGIEPALKPAALAHRGGRILVLATSVTLHEAKFNRLMAAYKDTADISTLACPGIVEYVERGITDGPELISYLQNLLSPYTSPAPDAVVLGCTHYPFVSHAIQAVLGSNCEIYDGADGAARQTLNRLVKEGLTADSCAVGTVVFHNSLESDIPLSRRLFYM